VIYLTQGIVLGLYAALMPGPLQFYLFGQTLQVGWRRTLPASLAPLFSDGPVVVLMLLVMAQMPAWLVSTMRLIGGLFILYLAWGSYSANRAPAAGVPQGAGVQSLARAVVMNLLNPNVYIFWATIGAPIVLEGWKRSIWSGWSFIIGMYGVLIPATAGLVVLFGTVGNLKPEIRRWVGMGLAALLAVIGVYQIVTGVRGFWFA
jgi:threonine/homoserine/homoserine lactone efflux protein